MRRRATLLLLILVSACSRATATSTPTAPPSFPSAIATTNLATPTHIAALTVEPHPTATRTAVPVPIASPTATRRSVDLTAAEIETLRSLEQLDDYPLYTMRFAGPYLAETGSGPAIGTDPGSPGAGRATPGWGCSLFAALGEPGSGLLGRNFDWRYSPALLLFTNPPDGYASVSTVDIAYLGFDGDRAQGVAELALTERAPLLATPLWPFDGMNERGLVVGMAAVPEARMPRDPDRPTLDSLRIIRELLDHAADVQEAVALFQRYNIVWDGGPALHYLVADPSGQAALIEFYDGEMAVLTNEKTWHAATNFLLGPAGDSAAGVCQRYDRIAAELDGNQGRLTAPGALALLEEVAQPNTQWSVVYGMDNGELHVALGGDFQRVHVLQLR
jgi:hypothetical protein